jgi:hypothetical protein
MLPVGKHLFAIAAVAALGVLGGAPLGCAKASPEQTVLQSEDLSAVPDGPKFDPNEILDLPSFTDAFGLDATQVQNFLVHTPYKRPSFLETYQSNGVRAVDAIVRVAQKYRINPLVFLVRLEMAQGLLGEQFYPFPPERVEYAFACGCSGPSTCSPSLAGIDKQLDCLGRTLRTSLDEVTANQQTSGGWGPGKEQRTVDGKNVTPADASTAVLYEYTPVVGTGKTGNWLFWNIWQNYATALDYQAPSGGGGGPTAWVGDACTTDPLCDYVGGICLQDARAPGGMCSSDCTTTDCPNDADHPATFCANFASGPAAQGICLLVCNANAPGACRTGYTCVPSVQKFNDPSKTESVCFN